MGVAMIDSHLSFCPAAEILRSWEAIVPTPPNSALAIDALAAAKATIRNRRARPSTAQLKAQVWSATPAATRRQVLRKAGLDPKRWEEPIHSFNTAERNQIRLATEAAVRVFDRLLHAL